MEVRERAEDRKTTVWHHRDVKGAEETPATRQKHSYRCMCVEWAVIPANTQPSPPQTHHSHSASPRRIMVLIKCIFRMMLLAAQKDTDERFILS